MQGVQTLGASAPQPNNQSQQASQWRTWHNHEADVHQRRQLVQHIYRLFSARQKAGMQDQWTEKMPDFVRRLEEALYRTANSKEEYADVRTLENRLQSVARRMVHSSVKRQEPGRPPMGGLAGGPPANGFAAGPGPHPSQNYTTAQSAFQAGGPSQFTAGAMPGGGQGSGLLSSASGGLGLPTSAGPSMHSPGLMGASMGALRPLSGQLNSSPQLGSGLSAQSSHPGMEPGMSGLGMQGMDSLQNGQQQQPGAARQAAGGPMMSNGAPVLLRNSRDWVPGQAPSLLNGMTAAQPPASTITINGMAPGQLGVHMPSMSGANGALQNHAPAMRMGANNMGPNNMMGLNNNGMIPIPGQQNSMAMGQSPMVPMSMQMQQGSQLNPALQEQRRPASASGMVPVSSSGGLGGSLSNMGSLPGGLQSAQMLPIGSGPGSGGLGSAPSTSQASPSVGLGANLQGDAGTEADFQAKLLSHNKEYIAKQQRWLLFLRHCAKCSAQQGDCQYGQSCTVAKALWRHILECADPNCTYPRCVTSRELLKHHQKCQSQQCPVCTPVKQYVQKQRLMMHRQQEQQREQQAMLHQQQARIMEQRSSAMAQARSGQLMQQQQQQQARMGYPGMYQNAQMSAQMNPAQQQAMVGMRRPSGHLANGGIHPDEPPGKRYKHVISQENRGTSLVEAFSAMEIKVHLTGLREAAPQQNGKGLLQPAHMHANWQDENACAACGQTRLTFEPPSLYCSCCSQRIKRNQVFYATPATSPEIKGYWCHACYSEVKGEIMEIDGSQVRKSEVVKRKNDEEQEEGWVACDCCERWVHQICGLFNKGRNDKDTQYICPMCLLQGLENRTREPIQVRPQAMLEAKDLPRCALSDILEDHLRNTLRDEMDARAKSTGVPLEQIRNPMDTLVVRVINNVNKKMEVKPKFLEAFRNEDFPDSFPYRQKVIVLFQRIEGVEVCLYCLYMQEYGEDAPAPNKRWVYLSYLDSIKYFQPEVESALRPGMALRTLVYHDILLSYLDYIKQRGFCSMFIWACPPLQGDDYILYCHPSRQKTPRSDRLREWYLSVLKLAKEQGVVTHLTNLFDTFFEGGRDHRDRASSTCLPYLDGDYWPGEAENLLSTITEEARQAGKKGKKAGQAAKGNIARAAKGKGKRYGAGAGTTDEQLMARLGETIQGMKEDFIVVHLQEPCSFCRTYISDANRYYHPSPPAKTVLKTERTFEGISLDTPGQLTKQVTSMTRFQLCEMCYTNESSGVQSKMRGLPTGIELKDLVPQKVEAIAPTHDTGNPILASEFFDTRQAFLSLCQGNHYQFDSLRRAKHSSMMVLYHLHNPEAPAFACTCNNCSNEIEPGQGFRCTECADFDMCATCKASGVYHPHPLQANVRKIDETQVRLTSEQQAERAAQLQRTMNLLVHASACNKPNCPSSNCSKVKALFQHAVHCQLKVSGGCQLCRRMWALLQLHAKQCQETTCPVPRCRELREMRRRQVARQEGQRRTAYQAMLRQQAAAHQQQSQAMAQGKGSYQ